MLFHDRLPHAEEESGGILRAGIEVREERDDRFLQPTIGAAVRHRINGKDDMESRTRTALAFPFHVVPAVDQIERNARERGLHVRRRFPVLLLIRMIVVAVKRQAVRTDEIRDGSVIAFVLGKDLIVLRGLGQILCARDDPLDRILRVEPVPAAVGCVQCDGLYGGSPLSFVFRICVSPF